MRAMSGSARPAIVYVCDQARLHQLALSLFSWRRFVVTDVFVVDFGLSDAAIRWLSDACAAHVLPPAAPPLPLARFGADARRLGAYREKARIGAHAAWAELGDRPLLYLDADIIVTERSFLDRAGAVAEATLLACPSVWDHDFNWTYRPEALASLRAASGIPDLSLSEPIPNSGVTCARAATWGRLSAVWAEIYDRFLALPADAAKLRDGALPGDQEFLALAARRCGVQWAHLHGSCNMQVDPRRMRWAESPHGPPLGGRFGEPPERVAAVHFGCDESGRLGLPPHALGTAAARKWLDEQVGGAWADACAAGLRSVLPEERTGA